LGTVYWIASAGLMPPLTGREERGPRGLAILSRRSSSFNMLSILFGRVDIDGYALVLGIDLQCLIAMGMHDCLGALI
jgi:hypothetical protein